MHRHESSASIEQSSSAARPVSLSAAKPTDELEAIRKAFIVQKREDGVEEGIAPQGLGAMERFINTRAPTFFEMGAWRDEHEHRRVFVSDEQRAFLTYCEGDVHLRVCPSDQAYWDETRRGHEFYRSMR